MSRKLYVRSAALTAVILAALVLAVTTVAAQEQDVRSGGDKVGKGQAGRAMRRPGLARQAQRQRGVQHPFAFLMRPEVEVNVTDKDDGVTIHLTTENAELAEKLQAQMPKRIEQMRERAGQWRERRKEREEAKEAKESDAAREKVQPKLQRKGLGLLASDKVDVKVAPTEAGVDIVMTSKDPKVVERIQKAVPKQIEQMKQFRKRVQAMKEHVKEHPGAMLRGAQMLNLMLSPEVETKLTQTEKGVVIELSSENAELAEKLKTVLPKRLENLRELREKMGEAGPAAKRLRQRTMQQRTMQRRERQQGPGRLAPGGRGTRQLRGRETRPSDEEIRKIIREEIRRYLEEEGTE